MLFQQFQFKRIINLFGKKEIESKIFDSKSQYTESTKRNTCGIDFHSQLYQS